MRRLLVRITFPVSNLISFELVTLHIQIELLLFCIEQWKGSAIFRYVVEFRCNKMKMLSDQKLANICHYSV